MTSPAFKLTDSTGHFWYYAVCLTETLAAPPELHAVSSIIKPKLTNFITRLSVPSAATSGKF